ncbi:CDP-glycerol--glycerophosphate glycerophosphotransferase [Arthrobacter sp. MYb227]|uniref:CDP-glycerol glycerophosphotransferase family protein n=1 Tax=Arthrobacter sp. MYb227 TaxID=1848601 RepID=UPI000CFDA6C3|nr:CDP-glycerol glycerophosphotransferase family protein [Arthrobacter sp. MYb227]PQZ92260.1 CDP-glycerol--glycerophosphate glycerophosphotransferase [Arthrobacter sp. MYb227]
MNPLNAAKTLSTIVGNIRRKRNAIQAINSSPLAFSYLPNGDDRFQAALYFADQMVNAYQLRQWYEPMRMLAKQAPVVVLVRNPETAVALRDECPLPIFFAPAIADIETMLESQRIETVFYVNQNIRNFQMMRFNGPAHVFVSHGESEKSYMWSNQLKAYDYVFSAGQAARDRLEKNLSRYNAAERTKLIGRPQIDVTYPAPVQVNQNFKTVLYAPTWEGDRPSMSYGSALSHGLPMLKALVAEGNCNIIFRPHPRSGINNREYKTALHTIRELFENSQRVGSPSYFYDETDSWGWQWTAADVCVTDISAVAYDWLATGKPIIVTKPSNPQAEIDESPALMKVPNLTAAEAKNAGTIIRGLMEATNHDFYELVDYYFGDTAPGASMQRFINESMAIISEQRQTT